MNFNPDDRVIWEKYRQTNQSIKSLKRTTKTGRFVSLIDHRRISKNKQDFVQLALVHFDNNEIAQRVPIAELRLEGTKKRVLSNPPCRTGVWI